MAGSTDLFKDPEALFKIAALFPGNEKRQAPTPGLKSPTVVEGSDQTFDALSQFASLFDIIAPDEAITNREGVAPSLLERIFDTSQFESIAPIQGDDTKPSDVVETEQKEAEQTLADIIGALPDKQPFVQPSLQAANAAAPKGGTNVSVQGPDLIQQLLTTIMGQSGPRQGLSL